MIYASSVNECYKYPACFVAGNPEHVTYIAAGDVIASRRPVTLSVRAARHPHPTRRTSGHAPRRRRAHAELNPDDVTARVMRLTFGKEPLPEVKRMRRPQHAPPSPAANQRAAATYPLPAAGRRACARTGKNGRIGQSEKANWTITMGDNGFD